MELSAIAIVGEVDVFWIWVSAFLGMTKVYTENRLSAKYSDNELKAPISYITKGLGKLKISAVFVKNNFIS